MSVRFLRLTLISYFGHTNVITYCNRPFKTVEEMDEKIINNWNEVIKPGDVIFHLGDFSFRTPQATSAIARRLNGQIHLIAGNHDRATVKACKDSFASVKDMREIKVIDEEEVQRITLCHYALRVWNKSHHGSYSLYGHSHGSLSDDNHLLSMDVGVDPNNFTPLSFGQIKTRMKAKTWKPIDHHGTREGSDGKIY